MRLRARPSVLLAALLLLALPAVAAADIKPIPKPDNPPPTHTITPTKAPVTPPSPPPAPPSPPPAPPTSTGTGSTGTGSTGTGSTGTASTGTGSTGTTGTGSGATGTGTTAETPVKVVFTEGGRDQSHVAAPVAPPPDPTPLQLVSASETLPSHDTGTPAWKLAVLALLAAGEAFLIVHLVRRRPATLSPAQ